MGSQFQQYRLFYQLGGSRSGHVVESSRDANVDILTLVDNIIPAIGGVVTALYEIVG
jgi:hypothetical protein